MPAGHSELAGVARYASLHGPWTIQCHPRSGFDPLPPDRPFDGDGMIVHLPATGNPYRGLRFPVVNVGSLARTPAVPSVLHDNHQIGTMAATHLIDRGFERIGFIGFVGHGYSDARCEGASQAAAARRIEWHEYPQTERTFAHHGYADFIEAERQNMQAWAHDLPKPAGIVCANDARASQFLSVCRASGVAVPEQLAVVGVDDDVALCQTTRPALSSVAIPFEQVGYLAAELLDGLMSGNPATASPLLVPPIGVVVRASSDILAVQDVEIAQALRHIRENAFRDVTVDEVLEVVPMSRRSFERRFKQVVHRTPQAEITRLRVELAKRLLSQSDLLMPQVAQRSGFASAERLSVVFRRETGLTPTAYRQQFRQR
jgi:LacI family transcriptional regulator